jgi:DMSO/TMAO reductase YedYZ molybdopterin-dependent catalytic subunit
MKKIFLSVSIFMTIFLAGNATEASNGILRINGIVNNPLTLTMKDLNRFKNIQVQLNDVSNKGEFKGIYYYEGVPLRTLLELACIEKNKKGFSKSVDLAIAVRNKKGAQIILSWGEVFYRNPAEIVIATRAVPIMPHKNCKGCHSPDFYKPLLDQLHRNISFPKLVVAEDSFADRSIEGITEIEVLQIPHNNNSKKIPKLFSKQFIISGDGIKTLSLCDLSQYPRKNMRIKRIGEGKGYHGILQVSGASLKQILDDAGVTPDLNTVFIVSAPDGYCSLLSYGEVFLNPLGDQIIVADQINGQSIDRGGRFILLISKDLMADRWVKAIEKIEVISVPISSNRIDRHKHVPD